MLNLFQHPFRRPHSPSHGWTLKQVQGDEICGDRHIQQVIGEFDEAISQDLNTPLALTVLEGLLSAKRVAPAARLTVAAAMDAVLGLDLLNLTRADLRLRPKSATTTEAEIEATLAARKEARAAKDFARSDALRDELAAQGVEVMDGDPLGWEWKLG